MINFVKLFENNDIDVINEYVRRFVSENGLQQSRHGLCFEFVEGFCDEHDDAEMWETLEMSWIRGKTFAGVDREKLPLVIPYALGVKMVKDSGVEFITDLGSSGGHAVCVWHGHVFDAGGISTFEDITKYFHTLENVHWFRSM